MKWIQREDWKSKKSTERTDECHGANKWKSSQKYTKCATLILLSCAGMKEHQWDSSFVRDEMKVCKSSAINLNLWPCISHRMLWVVRFVHFWVRSNEWEHTLRFPFIVRRSQLAVSNINGVLCDKIGSYFVLTMYRVWSIYDTTYFLTWCISCGTRKGSWTCLLTCSLFTFIETFRVAMQIHLQHFQFYYVNATNSSINTTPVKIGGNNFRHGKNFALTASSAL